MTQNEFVDMAALLVRDQDINQTSDPEFVMKMKKLALPGKFTLQTYIAPKLDARYITSFNDVTDDRLMGLRPNIDFDIVAQKYHNHHRMDDQYTRIKVNKMYDRYNQVMLDNSIN